jgi:predicted RNase H-like nuclease (RuvC/YqgF family)
MKSTEDELFSFSPAMLLYNLPDYDHLESIYKRACDILGIDPDCYDIGNRLDFIIKKGASIQTIIEFLKSETEQIELHLARIELIQNEYTSEDQIQLYRYAMENMDAHTEKLKNDITDLKRQINDLKKEITTKLVKAER